MLFVLPSVCGGYVGMMLWSNMTVCVMIVKYSALVVYYTVLHKLFLSMVLFLSLQSDPPADPHTVPNEVFLRPFQTIAIPALGEAKDGPPALGVHAGRPPHALWVSSSTSQER